MGVAGHENVLVLLALAYQLVEERLHGNDDVAQAPAGEQFQVYEHLVVARPARVYFLANVAELACEHKLYLGVDILHAILYDEVAALAQGVDGAQLGKQLLQLASLKEAYGLKHGDVRHGAYDIVFGKIEVHLAVAPDGEALYFLVYLKILFPEFLCHVVGVVCVTTRIGSSEVRRQSSPGLPVAVLTPCP